MTCPIQVNCHSVNNSEPKMLTGSSQKAMQPGCPTVYLNFIERIAAVDRYLCVSSYGCLFHQQKQDSNQAQNHKDDG